MHALLIYISTARWRIVSHYTIWWMAHNLQA